MTKADPAKETTAAPNTETAAMTEFGKEDGQTLTESTTATQEKGVAVEMVAPDADAMDVDAKVAH